MQHEGCEKTINTQRLKISTIMTTYQSIPKTLEIRYEIPYDPSFEFSRQKQASDRYLAYKHLAREVSKDERYVLQKCGKVKSSCSTVAIGVNFDANRKDIQEFILRNDIVRFLQEKRARRIVCTFFDKHRDKLQKLLWHPPNGLMVENTLKRCKTY